MTNRFNRAAVLSAVVLFCCAALMSALRVNAAGEGKITGTVKLDGSACPKSLRRLEHLGMQMRWP